MLREIASHRLKDAELGTDPEIVDRIRELVNAVNNEFDQLPSLDELQELELTCSNDVFLEVLIMAIKNSSLAHQHNFFKLKNAKKNYLQKKISTLKKNFNANAGEILRVERELNRIVDDEMREEILKMRKFEQLQSARKV